MKKKNLLPPTYFQIYFALMIILHFLFPIAYVISAPYSYLGVLFVVFGIGINIWTDSLFKKGKTTVKPFTKPSAFIISGPFQISRHPMYLGFVSILLGIAFLLRSLIAFLGPALMFFTLEYLFISSEEESMEQVFGKSYSKYKKQVRKWI
jgi:protein-S-isoprenylcysteine O-methyltransferase Ste14